MIKSFTLALPTCYQSAVLVSIILYSFFNPSPIQSSKQSINSLVLLIICCQAQYQDFISINTIMPVSYENNSGLCEGPLYFCNQHKYCVFEVSFRNGFVVSFVIFSFSFILFFPCLIYEKMQENEVEFFNYWFIIPFVSQESKAKENESKKNKNEGYVALDFFKVYAGVVIHVVVYVAKKIYFILTVSYVNIFHPSLNG